MNQTLPVPAFADEWGKTEARLPLPPIGACGRSGDSQLTVVREFYRSGSHEHTPKDERGGDFPLYSPHRNYRYNGRGQ